MLEDYIVLVTEIQSNLPYPLKVKEDGVKKSASVFLALKKSDYLSPS